MLEIGLASQVVTSATHNSDGPLTGSLGPPGDRIVKAIVLPFSEKETPLIHMFSGIPFILLCTPSAAGTTSVASTRAKPIEQIHVHKQIMVISRTSKFGSTKKTKMKIQSWIGNLRTSVITPSTPAESCCIQAKTYIYDIVTIIRSTSSQLLSKMSCLLKVKLATDLQDNMLSEFEIDSIPNDVQEE